AAPNGMWCRRRTEGFMSPRTSVSEATPSRFLEERASSRRERAQSAQRHLRPLRTARELAPQIAERGIELEQREERCHLLERCVQTRPARDLVVGREEYTAGLALPFIELRLPAGALTECLERRCGSRTRGAVPGGEVVAADRLGGERRIAARRRERRVQLRGARGEGLHESEVQPVRVRGRCHARDALLEIAHQMIDGVIPAIALVGDEGLEQRERG